MLKMEIFCFNKEAALVVTFVGEPQAVQSMGTSEGEIGFFKLLLKFDCIEK